MRESDALVAHVRLADAALVTAVGPIKLKGLPTLEELRETRHRGLSALHAYARHLLSGAVELAPEVNAFDALGWRDKLRAGFELITERGRNAEGQIARSQARPRRAIRTKRLITNASSHCCGARPLRALLTTDAPSPAGRSIEDPAL